MTATTEPVRILYIGGTGRTGSTLLEKLLGQLDGVFACGEMAYLWHGLRQDSRCSCGRPLRRCETWAAIFTEAFGGPGGIDADEMFDLRQHFRSVHMPLMVHPALRRRLMGRLGPYPERLARLYQAIASVSGATLLVDSSKEPHYSSILRSRPELDLRFVHLVRDPRAVAFSWNRRREEKALGDGAMMERRGAAVSAAFFDISNAAAEVMWASSGPERYLRIRYEDLVVAPLDVFRSLSRLTGVDLDVRGVLDGDRAVVAPTHSAWGNPNRFEVGPVRLRPDDEWTGAMSTRSRWASTVMTAPFLRRYGYPLLPPRSAG